MTITNAHLTPNPYSRPGTKLQPVKAIVLHWVANPGTSAMANRNYWESRKDGNNGYGSAHYIVDDNSIIETIPPDEMGYHVGAKEYTRFALECLSEYPNNCTVGVEMCHPEWDGKPTDRVWRNTVELVGKFFIWNNMQPWAITTHYSITGKDCHKWFVDHPEELERFRWDVAKK